jgi:hypothetical protein
MAEEQDQKQTEKQTKAKVIPIKEIIEISNRNIDEINSLETDYTNYNKKQKERDSNLAETEKEVNGKIILLKSNISNLNEQLRTLRENFSILTKNFNNYVKKTEIDYVKNKLDSIKFEQLATKEDLEKTKTSQ